MPPTTVANSSYVLNFTSFVSEHMCHMNYGALHGIEINIALDNQYALVALLLCSLMLIVLYLLRFLPLPQSLVYNFYAYVIDPPVFGSRHAVPVLFRFGIAPP
ncbi:hypothetical protein B0O99DRAFT_686386 [Bisporella sp. PMI_857]|nr:hypothetical protein B0O99DRAFT_686386 [Bisporella sp. PMI_857]